MRSTFLAAAALGALTLSSPAAATGGFSCRAVGTQVTVDIVVGHAAISAVAQVRVRDGRRLYATSGGGEQVLLAQSWIDEKGLKLDLVDGQALRHVARLSISFAARGAEPAGTLFLNQRRYRVRCTGEQ